MTARRRGTPNGVMMVRDVVWEWNMRYKLLLFEHQAMQGLRHGQCVMAFNKALTLCRVVNGNGDMIELRTDRQHQFDQEAIIRRMAGGWNVQLQVGAEILELNPPARKASSKKKAAAKKAPRRRRRAA